MSARPLLILSALLASSAAAAPSIDPQFGDHAVIQRNKPILITGSASPGEPLAITFAGTERSIVAGPDGHWQAAFPPQSAGGALTLAVSGAGGASARSSDIAIGDVWLCSGQSNMEYPLRRALNGDTEVANAGDPDLRVMKVAQQLAPEPRKAFAKPPAWAPTTPESAKDFSAACYFMARELRASQKVPIGAIDDTWGGTPIRQWVDETAARAGGESALVDMVEQYRSDPDAANRRFGESWGDWWRSHTGQLPGEEPWRASDRLSWKPVPALTAWDNWGNEWKSFDGAVWARKRVTLTAAQAAQPATLSLGVVDDMDETFVNGVPIGGTNDWSSERNYALPKAALHAGVNEILVYIRDNWGPGGLIGPADKFKLSFADGSSASLGSGWQYSVIESDIGAPPTPPWQGVSGVSQIYNAMIAPLGPIGLAGVAWYQGEADVGVPGYDRRLTAFMADWRAQFRDPRLPFLIVGLAGWGKPVSHPVDSGWAELINEQRLAVDRDPRAALTSAIDLGEPNDIHPANKQEVGRRLALAAKTLVYPNSGGTVGPRPLGATRSGAGIVISFDKPLQTLSGANANAVELCGPAKGSCRYALASVEGNKLVVAADSQPIARVRYAWADYPLINLYDLDLLPVPVFELPVQ